MPVELEFDYATAAASMDKFSQEDIDILREWSQKLDKSKNLPKDLTDKQLLLFYNACYGALDKTKACIEKYYNCRKNMPEVFDNRDLSADDLKSCMKVLEYVYLPGKSVAGYDVIFHRLHETEPGKYHFEPSCKILFMTVDACLSKRGPQPGYIFLFDMKGVRLGHLTRVGLVALRKFFTYIQEAMPVRMREVHVLNTEPILDKLLLLIRPFMDKKFFDLIKFHNKTEDLEPFYQSVIPRSSLPPDYGGTAPDTQTLHANCMQTLQQMHSYFTAEEEQRHVALDKKRNGKSLEANFKALDID